MNLLHVDLAHVFEGCFAVAMLTCKPFDIAVNRFYMPCQIGIFSCFVVTNLTCEPFNFEMNNFYMPFQVIGDSHISYSGIPLSGHE